MSVVWINTEAVKLIRRTAVTRRLRETGGPLFGYIGDTGDTVITEAHGPGPNARHERFRLISDQAETRRLIEAIHEREQGRLSYLGDWHTHPGGAPAPSATDTTTLRDLSSDDGMDLTEPLGIIVATSLLTRRPRVRAIRAWQWDPTAGHVRPRPITVTTVHMAVSVSETDR